MSGPERVQLRRTKGWRKPEGTIVVARPSKWGNPFYVPGAAPGRQDGYSHVPGIGSVRNREDAVACFRLGLTAAIDRPWSEPHDIGFRIMAESLNELSGKNLGCWCPLDQPCHADVLLELANPR